MAPHVLQRLQWQLSRNMDRNFKYGSTVKLEHDAAQFRHLVAKRLLPASFLDVADAYERLQREQEAKKQVRPVRPVGDTVAVPAVRRDSACSQRVWPYTAGRFCYPRGHAACAWDVRAQRAREAHTRVERGTPTSRSPSRRATPLSGIASSSLLLCVTRFGSRRSGTGPQRR